MVEICFAFLISIISKNGFVNRLNTLLKIYDKHYVKTQQDNKFPKRICNFSPSKQPVQPNTFFLKTLNIFHIKYLKNKFLYENGSRYFGKDWTILS